LPYKKETDRKKPIRFFLFMKQVWRKGIHWNTNRILVYSGLVVIIRKCQTIILRWEIRSQPGTV